MTVDRRLLPVTFGPWFVRFPGLTEVQQRAIPPILEGHDVLICSPTASGKTEAYAAPAAEMVRRSGAASAAALIVAPTRALTNDLKRRLEGPMQLVDVSFGRYTGEHKERVDGKLPSVVIATPEALDSLLARRQGALRSTRLVVLDEIHVLDNTPRGDQLRVLLHRLEQVAEHRPQRVAASATVDRPQELGRRYLNEPVVVVAPGIRRILARRFEGRAPAQMAAHVDDLARHGFRKVLVFCRSRNQVETFSAKLRRRTRFADAVFAHHGSLAKTHRERTERLFHQAPAAVCFATLTLELGIDIGTVDYVLLAALPADVPSLLQRIGRGGRRGDSTRCGYVTEGLAEDYLFQTMFRLGKEGRLCPPPYAFRPSILVQQALVLACAETYLTAEDLERTLPPAVHTELGTGACKAILERMVEVELLERSGKDRYVPAEAIEERYRYGSLHSNIGAPADVQVVDRMTGDVVGSIFAADTRKIGIGGRDRAIVKISGDRVLTDASAGAEPARFRPSASPSVSFALGRAVVESLGVARDDFGLIQDAGSTVILHGLGTIGSLFLQEQWKNRVGNVTVQETSPYTMKITSEPSAPPRPDEAAVDRFLRERVDGLTELSGAGPWGRGVPEALSLSSVRRMSGLDEIATFLSGVQFQTLEGLDAKTLAVIREL